MTDRNYLKEKYKHIPPEVLVNYGLLQEARTSGYICPFCGNGSGDDGTGIDMNLLNTGYEGHCFKCGESFDVFKIYAKSFGLENLPFPKLLDEMIDCFGDNVIPSDKKPVQKKDDTDFLDSLKKWKRNLKSFVKEQGGTYRGLTYEELAKYFCGYDPNFINKIQDKKNNWHEIKAPRFIIPSNRFHFLARLVGNASDLPIADNLQKILDKKSKQHFGKKSLFGVKMLPPDAKYIFVTEGEFDAMSIDQCGFPAISISGSNISKEMQMEILNFDFSTKFIILLDNDETGKNKSADIKNIFESLKYKAVVAHLDANYKDSNEFLQVDSDGLQKNLEKIFADTKNFFEKNIELTQPERKIEKPVANSDSTVTKTFDNPTAIIFGSTTKYNMPDCPIDLKVPSLFAINSDGIFKILISKQGQETQVKVSDTPIVITRIIETAERTDNQAEISIYDKRMKKWHSHIVLKSDLADNRKIVGLAQIGISITSSRAKHLAEFLNDIQYCSNNSLVIPYTTLYKKTGWTSSSCEKFIVPPGDGNIFVVQNSGFDYKSAYSEKGNVEDWINLFKKVFVTNHNVRLTLGFGLIAPMLLPCSVRNFQLGLIAKSGSGKSALAGFIISALGDPEKIRRTFNTTANSMNAAAEIFCDLPSWSDEFQSASKYLKEEFQRQIYDFAEGMTRQKLNRDSTQRPVEVFRGARIYTAEQPILPNGAGQGAIARCMELNCKNVFEDSFAVHIHEFIKDNYGHFLQKWIDFIIENRDKIKNSYNVLLNNYNSTNPKTGKPNFLPANVQLVAISQTALIYFCRMLGIADELKVAEFLPKDFYSLVADESIASLEGSTNFSRALQVIAESRYTHDKFFYHENIAYKKDGVGEKFLEPTATTSAGALGVKFLRKTESGNFVDDGDVAFFPTPFKKLVEGAGYPSAEAILNNLAEENLIQTGNNSKRKNQIQKRFGDKQAWFYYFPYETFMSADED